MANDHAPQPRTEGNADAAIRVVLPAALVALFPGSVRRLSLDAATVKEMVGALDARWPGMADRICDSTPAIRKHINVFVNGTRAKLDAPLAPGSDVYVLTAMSGG